jgi:citrate/tricarballylate utilization protein
MPETEAIESARRALEICNACRYCDDYCVVFRAMEGRRTFSRADLHYLANLCHNCRNCYYACQYAPPHEFDLNLTCPGALRRSARKPGSATPGRAPWRCCFREAAPSA